MENDASMLIMRTGFCLLCAMVLLFSGAYGASITVVNHSFEDISGESPSNEFTFGALNGWNLYEETPDLTSSGDGPTFFIGTLTPQLDTDTPAPDDYINFTNGAPDSQRVGLAFNFEGSEDTGEYGLEQTLTDTLQANTSYTLTVDIGNIASGQSVANGFFNLNGFPGYRIALLVDGVEVASEENGLSGTIPEGEFRTTSIVYATGSSDPELGGALGIRLVNLNDGSGVPAGNDLEVDFDNVRLDATPIPEPAAFALVCALVTGFVVLRRNRS